MKKLVVFYSYSGNTKKIANDLKDKLNCDILELFPVTPFSKNYDDVVERYQNNKSKKEVVDIKPIGCDLSKYDMIILGSPVWWYTITPVIRQFLKQNNLSGKTIIPFATHGGWVGRTFEEIKELCPNSKVSNEIDFRFEQTLLLAPVKKLDKWIDKIDNIN